MGCSSLSGRTLPASHKLVFRAEWAVRGLSDSRIRSPFGTGTAKQPSHESCSVSHGLQHLSHTLQPLMMTVPHATVPFSWPQLCGTMPLQVAMHSPGACVPRGSSMHCPVVELQLYIRASVGAGVAQLAMHSPGASKPARSAAQFPVDGSHL
jgi:hypothetical protein